MGDSEIQEAIRAYAGGRAYSAASTERWLRLDTGDAEALLQLATTLRLGENQLRDLWEWADEIALRDGVALHEVLAVESADAVRAGELSRNDKLKAIKAALRRRRFPQLAALEERLASIVRTLQLPRTVRITLPEHLEGDQIRIEIVAASAAAWRDAAASLLAAADVPACAELFALLGEAP